MTMHDVLDAQWMLDNHRDGENSILPREIHNHFILLQRAT